MLGQSKMPIFCTHWCEEIGTNENSLPQNCVHSEMCFNALLPGWCDWYSNAETIAETGIQKPDSYTKSWSAYFRSVNTRDISNNSSALQNKHTDLQAKS